MNCQSCQVVNINGIRCHETSCPDAWRDTARACKECGFKFRPESRNEVCCSHSCDVAYAGQTCNCDDCEGV